MNRIFSYIIVLTIFLDDFVITRTPFDFYVYYLFFLVFTFAYFVTSRKVEINKPFLIILLSVVGISIIKSLLNHYPITPSIKQFVALLISSVSYYLLFKINKFDLLKIFRIYLNLCVILCVLGILQEISYWTLGIQYYYSYKVTSILREPAHFAITLAPALFATIYTLFFGDAANLLTKCRAFIILLAYFLTMSAVALLGALIGVLLMLVFKLNVFSYRIKLKHILVLLISVVSVSLLTTVIYLNVPFIRFRIDDTWQAVTSKGNKEIGDINLSTYALYSNALVTKAAFLQNPLFGTGIGTHSLNYERHIDKVYNLENKSYRQIELNKDDANSLFLRLLSELGLFGLLLFLVFLKKNSIGILKDSKEGETLTLWLINNGCLLFFILRLIRFGNYSVLGFFLFAFLYYYSYKAAKQNAAALA